MSFEERSQRILCDGPRCRESLERDPDLDPDEGLVWPWRAFECEGTVGKFHACSDICEQRRRNDVDRASGHYPKAPKP